MRGEAVLAGVPVGDGHGDLLADGRTERAAAEGAERPPHAGESRGRVGDGAEHRGYGPEGAGDLIELFLDVSGGVVAVDERDVGHGMLLRLSSRPGSEPTPVFRQRLDDAHHNVLLS
ncbi:hypothetical protein GCM10009644_19880 [Microbacterium oxydans]